MNHNQFKITYLGKPVDYDHNKSYQCVDAARAYIDYVKNIPGYNPDLPALGNWGKAKDLFIKFPKTGKYFKKILNTPTGIPPQGALVFFDKTPLLSFPKLYGSEGHVAVVDTADLMNLILIEQNYPTGTFCSMRRHSYKDCLGWLVKK